VLPMNRTSAGDFLLLAAISFILAVAFGVIG
jgi:hypothetical protein